MGSQSPGSSPAPTSNPSPLPTRPSSKMAERTGGTDSTIPPAPGQFPAWGSGRGTFLGGNHAYHRSSSSPSFFAGTAGQGKYAYHQSSAPFTHTGNTSAYAVMGARNHPAAIHPPPGPTGTHPPSREESLDQSRQAESTKFHDSLGTMMGGLASLISTVLTLVVLILNKETGPIYGKCVASDNLHAVAVCCLLWAYCLFVGSSTLSYTLAASGDLMGREDDNFNKKNRRLLYKIIRSAIILAVALLACGLICFVHIFIGNFSCSLKGGVVSLVVSLVIGVVFVTVLLGHIFHLIHDLKSIEP